MQAHISLLSTFPFEGQFGGLQHSTPASVVTVERISESHRCEGNWTIILRTTTWHSYC